MPQGEISGKAFLDEIQREERKENAVDHYRGRVSYAGGDNDDNLSVMPGELVFGLRSNSNTFGHGMGPNEFGLSSWAGFCWGVYGSDDASMRDWYFMGVAKDEDERSKQSASGFAFTRAGIVSVINVGHHDLFAGDLVAWSLPDRSKDDMRLRGGAGTTNPKMLAELVPFDYADFTTHAAGALVNASRPSAGNSTNPGSSDIPIERLISPGPINANNHGLSDAQEESMGYKYGLLGAVLRGIEALQAEGIRIPTDGTPAANASALATTLGLFNTEAGADARALRVLAHILGNDQVPGTDHYNAVKAQLDTHEREASKEYAMLSQSLMRVLCGGIASSWYHKSMRVVGKVTAGGRPTATVTLNVGAGRRI